MLSEIQRHHFNLLVELGELCEANGLAYALANHTLWDAMRYGQYHDAYYETAVMMSQADLGQLQKIVAGLPDRKVVPFRGRGCAARYVNTHAVLLDYVRNPFAKDPMPGVEITLVRDMAQAGKGGTSGSGRGGGRLCVNNPKGQAVELSPSCLENTGSATVEGREFPVPEAADELVGRLVGTGDWRDGTWTYKTPREEARVVFLDDVSCEEFLRLPLVRKSLSIRSTARRAFYSMWNSRVRKPRFRKVEAYKRYLARTEARFDLWEDYYPRKGDILRMAQAGDAALEAELGELLDVTYEFYEDGLGFCVDEELLCACMPLLEKRYGPHVASEMLSLVPEEYRFIPIEDVLRRRGVDHPALRTVEGAGSAPGSD